MIAAINEARAYLRRIRKYIRISLAIFVISIFAGFLATGNYSNEMQAYLEEMQAFFASMQSPTSWGTFLMIFRNNAEAMLMGVLMGVFAGIFSLTFLIANGFVIGVFIYLYYINGLLPVLVMGVMPHGIIEIPAMLLSAAIGFRIGATTVGKIFRRKGSLVYELGEGMKYAVLLIVPALMVAAFIEAYLTPYFIALVDRGFSL